MEYVKSFRDLEVYKLSRQLSGEIFEISIPPMAGPKEEMYSLTGQIRRASRSVGASRHCGTEAWQKENTKNIL
jgi:four helix bundle protein